MTAKTPPDLIGEAKTGLSDLVLKRDLGVSCPTAWLNHHKLMEAMVERESVTLLCAAGPARHRLDAASPWSAIIPTRGRIGSMR